MKLNKRRVLNNYNQAIDGVDDTDCKLNNAETLLEAQYDELADIGDVDKHDHINNDTSQEFRHYYQELLTLNVVIEDIIDYQRNYMDKKIRPIRDGLAKMLSNKDN